MSVLDLGISLSSVRYTYIVLPILLCALSSFADLPPTPELPGWVGTPSTGREEGANCHHKVTQIQVHCSWQEERHAECGGHWREEDGND